MSLSHPTNRATFNHHHGVPGQRVPGATRQHGDGRHLLRLFLQGHAEADSGHVLEQITFEPGVVVHHLRGRMRNSTLPLVLRSGAGSRPNVPGLRADAASLAEHREMRFGLRVSPDTIRCGPGEAAFPPGDRPLRVFVDARTPRVVRSLRRNGPRPDTVPLRLLPEAARCPAAPPSDTVLRHGSAHRRRDETTRRPSCLSRRRAASRSAPSLQAPPELRPRAPSGRPTGSARPPSSRYHPPGMEPAQPHTSTANSVQFRWPLTAPTG